MPPPAASKPSARAPGSPVRSLVDRLNHHGAASGSSGIHIPGKSKDMGTPRAGSGIGATASRGKENARFTPSSSRAGGGRAGPTRSPSLFIPSPLDKGKQKAAISGSNNNNNSSSSSSSSAKPVSRARPIPAGTAPAQRKAVIVLDSSSSFSDDDDFPVLVKGPSSAAEGGTSTSTPRSPARSLQKPRLSDPAQNPSTSKASLLGSRLRIPNSGRSAQKSSVSSSGSSIDIIDIANASNRRSNTGRMGTGSTPLASPSSDARAPAMPMPEHSPSADSFWDDLSPSQIEQLEQSSGPSGSRSIATSARKPPIPGPVRVAPRRASRTEARPSSRAGAITIDDDDGDDEEDAIRDFSPPRTNHTTGSTDQRQVEDDAFLNFDDEDDAMYALMEEEVNAPASRAFESIPYAAPHHTPLSALPEHKRRQYLEQFGGPANDKEDVELAERAGRKVVPSESSSRTRYGGAVRRDADYDVYEDDNFDGEWDSDGNEAGPSRRKSGGNSTHKRPRTTVRKNSGGGGPARRGSSSHSGKSFQWARYRGRGKWRRT